MHHKDMFMSYHKGKGVFVSHITHLFLQRLRLPSILRQPLFAIQKQVLNHILPPGDRAIPHLV